MQAAGRAGRRSRVTLAWLTRSGKLARRRRGDQGLIRILDSGGRGLPEEGKVLSHYAVRQFRQVNPRLRARCRKAV
jgi:hypothetical protein